MRTLVLAPLGYILALLLVGTSPVGTGGSLHHDQLLDALVPHVHYVDGKIVGRQEAVEGPQLSRTGPVLGAGAGAAGLTAGVGIAPPVSFSVITLSTASERWRPALDDDFLPRGLLEAPPDPPPNA